MTRDDAVVAASGPFGAEEVFAGHEAVVRYAAGTGLGNLHHHVHRPSGTVVRDDRRVADMAVGHQELRMIERRHVEADAVVSQRLHEVHEIVDLGLGQTQRLDVGIDVCEILVEEIAAAVVELHHLTQRRRISVVEERRGEFHVAKTGCLEGTVDGNALAGRDVAEIRCRADQLLEPRSALPGKGAEGQRVAERILATHGNVLQRRGDADVVVALVVQRDPAVAHDHARDGRMEHTGRGECRTPMTGRALALAEEQTHAGSLTRRHRVEVSPHIAIERGLVGHQGRFVQLDGQSEEQAEVGLHLRVLARALGIGDGRQSAGAVGVEADELRAVPPLGSEGIPHHFGIGALGETRAGDVPVPAQNAVRQMYLLACKRTAVEQLLAQFGKAAAGCTHLEVAQRRP